MNQQNFIAKSLTAIGAILFFAVFAQQLAAQPGGFKLPKIPKDVKKDVPKVPNPAEGNQTGGANVTRQYDPQTGENRRVIDTGIKNGPAIIKYSLHLSAGRTNKSFPQKSGGSLIKRSWIPNIEFDLFGPVGSGDAVTIEFYAPDGKLWIALDVPTYEIKAGEFNSMQAGRDVSSEQSSVQDGNFSFKILLKNELKNTNKTLYAGTFKVGKVLDNPSGQAQYKDNYEFFVDQDWNLPIGYVYPNYKEDAQAAPLTATIWFRGQSIDTDDLAGYLFFNGKEIDSTKNQTAGSIATSKQVYGTAAESNFFWTQANFVFRGTKFFNDKPANQSYNYQPHYLDRNPGEYEIKILWKGKLARTAKFTVGTDGKIVDPNGVSVNNQIGWEYRVVPVTILGTMDGSIDRAAWKTAAFYGNPLNGFVAP